MRLRVRLTLMATAVGIVPAAALGITWWLAGGGTAGVLPPAEAIAAAVIALALVLLLADLLGDRLAFRLRAVRRDIYRMAVEHAEPPLPDRGSPEVRELSQAVATLWPLVSSGIEVRGLLRRDLAGRAQLEELEESGGRSAKEIAAAARRLRSLVPTTLPGYREAAASLDRIEMTASRLSLYCGRLDSHRAPVRINEAIDICVRALQPAAQASGGSLSFVPDAAVSRADVDPDQLHRLLLDLIMNAWAPPAGGRRVELRTRAEQDGVAISVRDDGESLTSEALGRLFVPFQGTHPRSSGLGLALCKRIALAHGGSIAAANVSPHGLEITVRLPSGHQGTSAL